MTDEDTEECIRSLAPCQKPLVEDLLREGLRLRIAIENHLTASGMMCEELSEEEIDEGTSVCENEGCTYCGLSRALRNPTEPGDK